MGITGNDFAASLLSATKVFSKSPEHWQQLQHNAMKTNFSWQNSAASYFEMYTKV
jgi:glycogen synthase